MKTCGKCSVEKPLSEFHKMTASKDGHSTRCKTCAIAVTGQWAKDNRKAHNAHGRKWEKDHPEKASAKRARHRRKHPEQHRAYVRKWQLANPEMHTANRKRDRKKHLHRGAAAVSRRRAAKLAATPAWTNHVAVGEFYSLAAIKTRLTGEAWHVDHIVPLRSDLVCGLHTHYNLQVMHGTENIRKSNKVWPDMPEAYAAPLHI